MFGSAIMDIAIGLIFVFLLLSLVCSAAKEFIELFLKKRASDLEQGISELFNDPQKADGFINAFYNHGLINSLYRGNYTPGSRTLPSYIPASNFALAIIDLRTQINSNKGVKDSADPNKLIVLPPNLESAISAFEATAAGDLKKLQAGLESLYNSAMDRVSGWYKRRTQFIIGLLGLVVAIAVNADCVEIAKKLSSDASLRQGIVALAEAEAKKEVPAGGDKSQPIDTIKDNIKTLDSLGLPIGWPDPVHPDEPIAGRSLYAVKEHWLGWLLTTFAISLGAPFWFDLLNKFIVVRSTVKPHEKSQEEKSKDPK
jgi:hypothetical protein